MDWRELFAAVFAPTDIIEIRTLPNASSSWFNATDTEGIAAKVASSTTLNVYFGANPRRDRGGRKAADVPLARCLFVDLDGLSVDAAAMYLRETALPAPTAAVFSGGGVHYYWRLEEPITDLAAWSGRQRGIIAEFARCNAPADRAIHDPPRIMRVPGTFNHKRGKLSALLDCTPSRIYTLDDFPAPESAVAVPTEPLASGGVSAWTERFLRDGAAEGERNARLFQAACDVAGRGVAWGDAERMLIPAAMKCGLTEREARGTIRSAFQKPRAPNVGGVVLDENTPIGAGYIPAGGAVEGAAPPPAPPGGNGGGGGGEPPAVAKATSGGRSRGTMANTLSGTVTDPNGKSRAVKLYRPIDAIAHDLRELTGGWPRLINGKTFVVGETNDARFLASTDDLFSWVHTHAAVRWSDAKGGCLDRETLTPLTPVTKAEFASFISSTSEHRYESSTSMPHHPPMRRTFYFPFTLPESDGSALAGFLEMMNPETDADRVLMLSALLTLGWGGEPGTRPVFVFRSQHGMGSGKTSTAQAIASVWGGAVMIDPDVPWADACKGLMSSGDWNTRCLLFDNIRSRFGTSTVEAAITAKVITGHRMYVGTISRPNDVCVFLTFNTPELSPDFAQRAVVVNIGPQRHGVDFVASASAYVRQHRWAIIADCMALLSGPDAEDTGDWVMDRWSGWARGVLAKCPGGSEAMRLIALRRPEVDADAEEVEGWGALLSALLRVGTPISSTAVEVTGYDVRQAAIEAGLWVDDKGRPLNANVIKCAMLATNRLAKGGRFRKANPRKVKSVTLPDGGVMRSTVYVIHSDDDADELPSDIPV